VRARDETGPQDVAGVLARRDQALADVGRLELQEVAG
jgi:hypothetical protein